MATSVQILSGKILNYSTSAVRYCALDTGGNANATESYSAGIVAKAGTLKNLRINISASPGTGDSFIYTVYKNGSPTALTVTIAESAGSGYDDTHEVSVVAGDYISLEILPTGSPASSTTTFACEFHTTTNNTLLMGNSYGTSVINNYFLPVKGQSNDYSAEFQTQLLIPCAGTLSDFYLRSHAAAGAGKTVTYTVYKNGVATSLVVALSGGSDLTGNDTAHSVSLVAGDKVTIKRTGDTTSQFINVGFAFTPETEGNFIIGIIPINSTLNTTNAYFYPISTCATTGWNTEANSDVNFIACTIKNMYVELSAQPSAEQVLTLQNTTVGTELSVTIGTDETTGNDSGAVSISDDNMLSTGKTATTSQSCGALISYTGYRVDQSTYTKTITADAMVKQAGLQETITADAKVIAAREQKTITSDAIIKTVNQKTITSDAKIKVEGTQKTITADAYISHSVQATITADAIIKQAGVQKTITGDAIVKIAGIQKTITSDAEVVQRIQKTITADARIEVVYSGKFIHNSDIFLVTDTSPANIIKIDSTNPAVYTIYPITGTTSAKALAINHTTEKIYVSLAGGKVAQIDTDDPSIQTILSTSETEQLYSISHNPEYLSTFIADANADDSLFTLDEATYGKINTDFRTQADEEDTINTWFGTTMGSKINSDFRTRKETESQITTDVRFIKSAYTSITPLARTDFHVYVDAVQLGDDDLKLDSIKIVHTADNKDTASFTLLRKHDAIDTPVEISNNNVVTIYIGTKLEFTGKITAFACNSESEKIDVNCEADNINEVYNIVTKELPLTVLNTQLHLYDVLVNNIQIENPYLSSLMVIVGNSNKYWTGTAWSLRLSQALTFATSTLAEAYIETRIQNYIEAYETARGLDFHIPSSHTYSFIDLDKYIQIEIDDLFLEQRPVTRNYEENPQYYRGIRVNLGTQIQQSVEQWLSSHSTSVTADELTNGTFKFRPGYSYFWEASVKWFDLGGGYRPSGWQYIGTSLSSLSTDLYEILFADYRYQKINDDIETDLGNYYLGTAPYKDISTKNGKKIIASRWEDKEDGLYSVTDEGYDYEAYAKAIAAIELEKIKDINGNFLPKASGNIDLTIDGYLYYALKLLTRINIVNTTTANVYKNDNGFPISIKQITIDSSTMKVNIVGDNTKSNWELERLTETYPDEPDVIKATEIKESSKFDLPNWETVDGD